MKRCISLLLAIVMVMMAITPALAREPDVDFIEDTFTFHVNGRPTDPVSRRWYMMDGRSYVNLREAADALGATVEWDGENQVVHWNPAEGGNIISISFAEVGGFNEDGTIWVPENFIWDVFWLTSAHFSGSVTRSDIPYASPVVRTTDHGQMAVDFIEIMNDTLYNRVPFSYRELEAALWIKSTLIEMGYDESAVEIQTFTIEDLLASQGFFGGSLGMYEQFNAFDSDLRVGFDDAIDLMIELMIEQENEWIAMIAEDMGISFEEAKEMMSESFGMFADMFDKFVESAARESAPWRLEMANVFGLFDLDTEFQPQSQNVILTVPGQSERTIIVTAHYDSIMVPGASDNASGTALLLESAYRLLDVDNYFTIKYVFMGAEEIGLLGAFYYVDSLTQAERNNIVLNINADVLFEGPYFFFGAGVHDNWWLADNEVTLLVAEVAEMVNATYGTALINAQPLAEMPSDQLAFLQNGHSVVALVGLARAGSEGYEEFFGWHMYPGFSASIVHTDMDDFHYINERWPNKIGDAMWTFSLFLEYLLVAEFDYQSLPGVTTGTGVTLPEGDVSDHPIVGTWVWDDNTQWTFVFNPDGTGSRGLPGQMREFTWFADDFSLLITMDGRDITEFWELFGIDDDALVLSLQWSNFFYTRQ
ncbi:MAG: M28 family peptidase [Defluviitaleaceae bacterium]|nr:M28 family peptidase [Defluviitaleaceae bacterium]